MSANITTCFHGSLTDLAELLNSGAALSLEDHRAALANLAGKLEHLERRIAKLEPERPAPVCAMQGCSKPVSYDDAASGAFCAHHEHELRLEQEITE